MHSRLGAFRRAITLVKVAEHGRTGLLVHFDPMDVPAYRAGLAPQ